MMQDNKQLYPACNKVISHLTAVSEELVDVPLYFSLHDVCKTVKCTPPKADVLRSALINAGECLPKTDCRAQVCLAPCPELGSCEWDLCYNMPKHKPTASLPLAPVHNQHNFDCSCTACQMWDSLLQSQSMTQLPSVPLAPEHEHKFRFSCTACQLWDSLLQDPSQSMTQLPSLPLAPAQ